MEREREDAKREETKVEAEDRNETVMSVFIKEVKLERQIGLAIINPAERKFWVSEFVDNEFFSNLENTILQVTSNDQEPNSRFRLIVPFAAFPHLVDKLKDLFGVCEIPYVDFDSEHFTSVSISQSLKVLLNPKAKFLLNEAEMDIALSALGAAIHYMRLLSDATNHQQFVLETYRHTQFMRLDVAATRALNVFSSKVTIGAFGSSAGPNAKLMAVDSLYGLLNKCKTKIGSRLLKKWLMQPLQDEEEIETRLRIVDFLRTHRTVRQTLQSDYLRLLPDIEILYTRFYKVKAKKRHASSLADCVKAYQMVQALKKIAAFMASDGDCSADSIISERYTSKLAEWCKNYAKLEELVELSIDFDKVSQHEYVIHPRFSEELQVLRGKIDAIKARAETLRGETQQELGTSKTVKLVESNAYTFLFEIEKKEGADKIRASKRAFKVVSAKSRMLTFHSPELQALCKEYNAALNEYRSQQQEVTNKVLNIVASYYPIMEATAATISELDVLTSFAQVADTAPKSYVKPVMRKDGNLRLVESRHPLIEWNRPADCIANDCEFDRTKHTLHVITGLNMGGKSTYIRQVGISVYLAHVGCFVPCTEAHIPLVDCIIARVGAADHQLRGISTFMAEMLEVSCMLKSATSRSLLLVDEIGRGTSTDDGFGLAWAIAAEVASNTGSLCLFATHFNELTEMARKIPTVKNYYVDAAIKENQITMLYKVKEGAIDKSYGIHVLEMLNFPPEIIQSATHILREIEEVASLP